MSTWNDIDHIERRLKASIIGLNKKKLASPTLVEAIDEEGIWPGDFEEFATWVPPRADIETFLRRAPIVVCAAATEIGFRYEGVGTVFWERLSDALGMEISLYQRQQIADEFKSLALRYKLAEPPRTAFSQHFSLIAWPISQALLPIDLIDPVMRMLSAAPVSALPAAGRMANFNSLRAWSGAAEGIRLTDWLRIEEPAERVLTALLYDNRGSPLSPLAYRRIVDRITLSNNAPSGLRRAKTRVKSTKPIDSVSQTFGRLTLVSKGGLRLFASWPPLPVSHYEEARLQARAKGWRPRLWGAGAYLHPDNALGGGPFALSMPTCPTAETPAYANAAEIFGAGSEITLALANRAIDWTSLLLFDSDDEGSTGEQRFSHFSGSTGRGFIGSRVGGTSLDGLRGLGRVCGYDFFEADLSRPDHVAVLGRAGVWTEKAVVLVSRHPTDAIGAPSNTVRPGRPFIVYDLKDKDDLPPPQTADRPGPFKAGGVAQLRCESAQASDPGLVTAMILERDQLFASLVERRLEIRIESSLSIRDVPIRAVLSSRGRLLAVGRMTLPSLPAILNASSELFEPLLDDRVRGDLLAIGRGTLALFVAHTLIAEINLERPAAMVMWKEDGLPHLADPSVRCQLVSCDAHHPHLFQPVDEISVPNEGVSAFGLQLTDRGVVDPIRIFVPDRISFGDLAADFGPDVSRRLFDGGLGSADIARAKINWSRAIGDGLLFIGVKERIVRQFDAPLVARLCGEPWLRREERTRKEGIDPLHALWRQILQNGLAELPGDLDDTGRELFEENFRRHASALDPDWPSNTDIPLDGAMDEALNRAFADSYRTLQERGLFEDLEIDFDFGSETERWNKAASEALRVSRRESLARMIAPSDGGAQLRLRPYDVGLVDLAEDLAAWTKQYALPRGQMGSDVAAACLHLWLSPAACEDLLPALKVLSNDPFVSRAVRYAALRYRANILSVHA